MSKRITILDPHGVEVVVQLEQNIITWRNAVEVACDDLAASLRENPKLGTYTVTVKEVA